MPSTVKTYSKTVAELLDASRKVATVLLEEHRAYHRELVNSRRRDPRVWQKGDIVFAHRTTKSNAAVGKVGKLMFPVTGPWRVIEASPGGSYKIEHCFDQNRVDKKHASHLSVYPLELVNFEPVDGPDNRYGQLRRPIAKSPFEAAGLKGFTPLKVFSAEAHYFAVQEAFRWPTCQEMDADMDPFPWRPGERERIESESIDGDTAQQAAVMVSTMYNGPPPAPLEPAPVTPKVPSIGTLVTSIIKSVDRLFLVADDADPHFIEWRLVRVALDGSMSLHPSCLQDGRFLVEFYIAHTDDVRFNGINQRFWLQYHSKGDVITPTSQSKTHLIRPSATSEDYASKELLVPFRKWINLTHTSAYIHGPFEFTSVRGRKSRDRIGTDVWKILSACRSMYSNDPLKSDVPSYSVHADRNMHEAYDTPLQRIKILQSSASTTNTLYL